MLAAVVGQTVLLCSERFSIPIAAATTAPQVRVQYRDLGQHRSVFRWESRARACSDDLSSICTIFEGSRARRSPEMDWGCHDSDSGCVSLRGENAGYVHSYSFLIRLCASRVGICALAGMILERFCTAEMIETPGAHRLPPNVEVIEDRVACGTAKWMFAPRGLSARASQLSFTHPSQVVFRAPLGVSTLEAIWSSSLQAYTRYESSREAF